jgi:short-subunit dehydrogenase
MHVVVTGASSGIGEAVAREFARQGVRLTLVARRRSRLEALAASLVATHGAEAAVVEHDLSHPVAATDWLSAAVASFGPVDVLVNNAGVQIVGATVETDPARGDALIATNLLSPLRLSRAVLPSMLARGKGTIVDVASVAALAPLPGMAWYSASKAGLAAASESMRGELRGTGVHVVTVYPGIIENTAMSDEAIRRVTPTRMFSIQPRGNASELARRMRRAVERRHDRVIYPSSMSLARRFPAATRWLIDRYTPPFAPASDDAAAGTPDPSDERGRTPAS